MKKLILFAISHLLFAIAGFGAGIYALPILTQPDAPGPTQMQAAIENTIYQGQLKRDLRGSDFLHWGEGTVSVGQDFISLEGRLAPGPDYKLYLSPEFVETEAEFNQHKPLMVRVGDVKTFENFIVPVPESIDVSSYNTVIVWCESFGEFITAARYKEKN